MGTFREDQMRDYYRRHALYERQLVSYQSALVKYKADLDEWNSLSQKERAARHAAAESDSRMRWSLFLGICCAAGLFFLLRKYLHGTWFWVVWGAASALAMCIAVLDSRHVGLVARSVGYAVVALILAVVFEFIVDQFSRHYFASHDITARLLFIFTAVLGFLIGMFVRASGVPRAPSPPKAPIPP